jgi:hypothetical protein
MEDVEEKFLSLSKTLENQIQITKKEKQDWELKKKL